MDLSNAPGVTLNTAGIALIAGLIVSLLKPYMEETFLPLASPLHNATIRLVAIVVGVVACVLGTMTTVGGWPDAQTLLGSVGQGALAGIASIATYHLYTTGMWDDNAPDAPATGATTPVPVLPRIPPPPPPGSGMNDPHLKA
jgi:hypothetical protein